MTEPCIPEKHEPRPQEESTYGVCKCGHYWHDHKVGLFGLYWTDCEKCMCSRYRKLGKFTFDEVSKLKHCDENE